MKNTHFETEEHRPLKSTLQELWSGMKDLIRSEAHLVQAEVQNTTKHVTRHAAFIVGFGVIAVLGILPFIAFLVIGLGRIMNHNYWLSSLLVSLLCFAVGGLLAYRFAKKMKSEDLTLPRTRKSLQFEVDHVENKIQEIRSINPRRAS